MDLLEFLTRTGPIVLDGAMGTQLAAAGLQPARLGSGMRLAAKEKR